MRRPPPPLTFLGRDVSSYARRRGLGQAPSGFQLPSANNVQAQVQAGGQLVQQIEAAAGGDAGAISSLLAAGVAIAGNAGGEAGQVVSMIGGAFAGFAMAGPVGAAISIVGSLASMIGNLKGLDTAQALGASVGTATISSNIQQLKIDVGFGPNIGKPGGWSVADWSAFARPPSSTKNADKLLTITKNAWKWIGENYNSDEFVLYSVTSRNRLQTSYGPIVDLPSFPSVLASVSPETWAKQQLPVCTPVWFYWSVPGAIIDCENDILFGSGGAGASVDALQQRWVQGTTPAHGISASQIVSSAISRLPDPLYWSAALYAYSSVSGFSGYETFYYNVDLLNAIATVLTMLAAGASTKAIVAELLLQSYILSVQGETDASSGQKIPDVAANQYGFHQLVSDYIELAQQEEATGQVTQPVPASFWSGWSTPEIVAASVGVAAVAGVLGYSAYSGQSPVEIVKTMGSKAGSKIRGLRGSLR
jgi:hypothetical protein